MIAGDIVEDALRKIGVVAGDEPANADQSQSGLRALGRFLRSIQNREPDLWLATEMDIVLTTAAAYAPLPAHPRKINAARLVRAGVETPMMEITREEYDALPVKTTTGLPSMWYFDRQRNDGTLYVWPVMAAANGEIVRLTYERAIRVPDDVSDRVDAPDEWEEAIVYGLAARLADDYGVAAASVMARAEDELRRVLSRDREGSMYFGERHARY